ncbi:Arm DNA-binding domain-containing protein [Symbiopectobacterium purcellii]|uniref:Arm DNA-binding domain-containing protein n=1 Tax=Symbiopectobacterium purcellii TaxID=2871826 RepID=UPI003D9C764B
MYLVVNPNGSRNWHLKYRSKGKASRFSLGAYPLITLPKMRYTNARVRACAMG